MTGSRSSADIACGRCPKAEQRVLDLPPHSVIAANKALTAGARCTAERTRPKNRKSLHRAILMRYTLSAWSSCGTAAGSGERAAQKT
jgi:hypothetical protein